MLKSKNISGNCQSIAVVEGVGIRFSPPKLKIFELCYCPDQRKEENHQVELGKKGEIAIKPSDLQKRYREEEGREGLL